MLTRKCIVSQQEIDTILKPVVLATLDVKKGSKTIKIRGTSIKAISWRYKTFLTKGQKCVGCGREGTIWALERHDKTQPYHLNLYASTPRGEVIMTKDHIIPVSQGGLDELDNFQTMCSICNHAKDNPLSKNDYEKHYVHVRAVGAPETHMQKISVILDRTLDKERVLTFSTRVRALNWINKQVQASGTNWLVTPTEDVWEQQGTIRQICLYTTIFNAE